MPPARGRGAAPRDPRRRPPARRDAETGGAAMKRARVRRGNRPAFGRADDANPGTEEEAAFAYRAKAGRGRQMLLLRGGDGKRRAAELSAYVSRAGPRVGLAERRRATGTARGWLGAGGPVAVISPAKPNVGSRSSLDLSFPAACLFAPPLLQMAAPMEGISAELISRIEYSEKVSRPLLDVAACACRAAARWRASARCWCLRAAAASTSAASHPPPRSTSTSACEY